MMLKWTVLSVGLLAVLATSPARAAVVAVMPVEGVNITLGQGDAIGVLFANALARETSSQVVSPLDTKPMLSGGLNMQAVAARLGAVEYIALRAVQLGAKINLYGIRFDREAREVFRSESAAPSMDEMQLAVAQLARSLAWRQPIAASSAVTDMPEPAPAAPDYSATSKGNGVKTGLWMPVASGRSFAPILSAQFDGRFGSRDSFVEFGAGLALPSSAESGSGTIEMGGLFVELGGSYFLSNGNVAPYLGLGVSPRIWFVTTSDSGVGTKENVTCTGYGQAGIVFTRDSRAKIYAELRVSQYLLGIANDVDLGFDGTGTSGAYHPTQFDLQVGIGW
jgi:hypothetical protein